MAKPSRDNPEPDIVDTSDGIHPDLTPPGVPQERAQPHPENQRDPEVPQEAAPEQEHETIDSSPYDVKRKAIMAKSKRQDSDEFDQADLTGALFGLGHRPEQEAPSREEPDIDVQQPQAPPEGGGGERIHGNTRIPLIFGDRQVDVPMATLRQLSIDSGVPVDNLTDKQVIAIGRAAVAQRLMYDELQRRSQQQPQAPAEPEEPQPDEFQDFIHEMQFGEETEAANKFKRIVDNRARQIAAQTTEQSRAVDYEQRQIQDIDEAGKTAVRMPGYARAYADPLFEPLLVAAIRREVATELHKVLPAENLAAFDTPEKQGRLIRELRARNIRFPSDRELVERGYREAVGRLGGPQQGQAQNVTVDLSTSRAMRSRQATSQPRASSAAPQPAPSIPRGREIVMKMRMQRGQPVA